MENRAGKYVNNLSGDAAYQSFVPAPLPPMPRVALDEDGMRLLVMANKQLALLDGLSKRIPNVDLFVSMYVKKEALMSSQIEGTQATLDDIFNPLIEENVNINVADVVNYVKATNYAVARLKELPLCNRLLKETHALLMEGVREHNKNPGEYRNSQNWIGGQGSTLKTARYIPPSVLDMKEAMMDLEKFINVENDQDILVNAGLIHYQFETIHPFLDGNGRIGRLLIILYLMEKGLLSAPILYISYYLKQNRIEYYDRLSEVRKQGDYEQWIKFFLIAVYESAKDAVETIDKLVAIHDKNVLLINDLGRSSENTMKVFSYLESNPIIDIQMCASALNIAYNTAANAINSLVKLGILQQLSNKCRNRTFAYLEYLDILRGGTE